MLKTYKLTHSIKLIRSYRVNSINIYSIGTVVNHFSTNSNSNEGSSSSTVKKSPFSFISDNLKQAWDEMTGVSKDSALKKKVHQADSFKMKKTNPDVDVGAEAYEGPTQIILVKEPLSAWESMKNRLADSPIIRGILSSSAKAAKLAASTELGKQVGKQVGQIGQKVQDKVEDAKDFWETSQNPVVLSMANMWDNMSSETEEGMTIAKIRMLDPTFVKEEWAEEAKRNLVPKILHAHFTGDIRTLKPWVGEAVYHKLAADIKERKREGRVFDSHVLGLDETQLILQLVPDTGPVIVGVYMVQQINCIRNREGEIIEGSENDIRAKFYSIAFKQEYIDEEGVVIWKAIEFMFVGDIPYL